MHHAKIMKRIPLIALLFFAVAIPGVHAAGSGKTASPFGIFNFNLDRLAEGEAGHIDALKSIGYTGLVVTLRTDSDIEKLARYEAAIGDGPFKIYGGYFIVQFRKDLEEQNAHIDKAIRSLARSKGKLCLVLNGKDAPLKVVVDFLRSAAERCKAAGIELVIFPHVGDHYVVKSAEDALPYIEEIQSDNIFITIHLAYEVAAGHGDRVDEVVAKLKPWIRLPSVNGVDADLANGPKRIKPGVHIKPLVQGDYEVSQFLEALRSVDYNGPVILHSWGLQDAPVDHYETSFNKYQEMAAALDAEEASETTKAQREAPQQNSASAPTLRPRRNTARNPQPSRITPEDWRAVRQNIRKASLEGKIEYLLDRAEIEDIITTYAYSVDTRDWPLHGALFKESFQQRAGAAYRKVDNQDRLGRMVKYFKSFTSTQHLGFPLVIQLDGDTAYATASLHARHFDESGDPKDNTLLFGQYEFWFERTAEGWKVSQLGQVNRTRINTSEAIIPEEGSPPRVYPKL